MNERQATVITRHCSKLCSKGTTRVRKTSKERVRHAQSFTQRPFRMVSGGKESRQRSVVEEVEGKERGGEGEGARAVAVWQTSFRGRVGQVRRRLENQQMNGPCQVDWLDPR